MVCEDCKSKLSVISAPDPWKDGSRGGSSDRRLNENKLLRKGVRSNPYGNACKICKLKCQQNCAIYCSICAYAKGVCAICGKQVLDTSMYRMSEGGQFGTVRKRDDKAFKSPEQMAREEAQQAPSERILYPDSATAHCVDFAPQELFEYLESKGQVGMMPTKKALESAGKKALAETLVKTFGGLNAAAVSLGLSKRNLVEEAEQRKAAKMQVPCCSYRRTLSLPIPPCIASFSPSWIGQKEPEL